MDPTYPWSDSNPYKFQFLGPADEILEEVLEYEVRNYAEHEWDERGLITMTFVPEIGKELPRFSHLSKGTFVPRLRSNGRRRRRPALWLYGRHDANRRLGSPYPKTRSTPLELKG